MDRAKASKGLQAVDEKGRSGQEDHRENPKVSRRPVQRLPRIAVERDGADDKGAKSTDDMHHNHGISVGKFLEIHLYSPVFNS